MRDRVIKRSYLKSNYGLEIRTLLLNLWFDILLSELLLQTLETNEIGKILRKYSFSTQNEIYTHSLFWVCFIFCWLEALLGLSCDFFSAFKRFHFLSNIKGLLIWRTNIAEHRWLVIGGAKGCFVEDITFVRAYNSFTRTIYFGWVLKKGFLYGFFWGVEILEIMIVVVNLFALILWRGHSSNELAYFLFIDFHRYLSNLIINFKNLFRSSNNSVDWLLFIVFFDVSARPF